MSFSSSPATKPSQGFNSWFGNNPVRVRAGCMPQPISLKDLVLRKFSVFANKKLISLS